MKNKTLIINGHPNKESFCFALAQSYKKGADAAGISCKLINLIDLDFNPILTYGYSKISVLEPDLLQAQQDITDADHLVFVYPTWWGTYPALLKGFFDRVFLPGYAFKYRKDSPLWDKLLKGKTARLIVTMDAPWWYYALVYRSPGHNSMKRAILEFCGIKPVRVTAFAPIKSSDAKRRNQWLQVVESLGAANA
jgi:NAD(P)H dehydrogenase (quinone)